MGAKWWYDGNPNTDCIEGDCEYLYVESIGDTTILSKTCRILKYEIFIFNSYSQLGYQYVFEDSGSVSVYDSCSNNFYEIFNFNSIEGDTVVSVESIHCGFLPTSFASENLCFQYEIGSIDSILIDGITLKRYFPQVPLTTTMCGVDWWLDGGEVIERIGHI